MNWSPAIQALAAGLGAALPVAAAMAWVIRKVFSLGEWKETLATKEHVAAMQQALQQATKRDMAAMQQANDKAHAGITKRLDETCAEVSELKSTVAVLASSVEATRTDVGRILDHLLDSKET